MIQEVIDKIEKRLKELDRELSLMQNTDRDIHSSHYISMIMGKHTELTKLKTFCHEIQDRP